MSSLLPIKASEQLNVTSRTGTPASSSSQGIGFAAERRGSIFRGENEYLDRGQTGSWKRRRGSPRNRQWDLHAAVLNQRSSESERECAHFIQMLDIDIREHLVELFWTFYNPISQLTRRQLFIDALEYGSSDFYSPHLHLAILAIGLRYADTSRHLRRLLPDGRESLLHRELKQRLENLPMESVRVPHLQAMLLLADLEYACGRETTSRTYLRSLLLHMSPFPLNAKVTKTSMYRSSCSKNPRSYYEFVKRTHECGRWRWRLDCSEDATKILYLFVSVGWLAKN